MMVVVVVDTRGRGRGTHGDSAGDVVQAFEEELGVGGGDWFGWHGWCCKR